MNGDRKTGRKSLTWDDARQHYLYKIVNIASQFELNQYLTKISWFWNRAVFSQTHGECWDMIIIVIWDQSNPGKSKELFERERIWFWVNSKWHLWLTLLSWTEWLSPLWQSSQKSSDRNRCSNLNFKLDGVQLNWS